MRAPYEDVVIDSALSFESRRLVCLLAPSGNSDGGAARGRPHPSLLEQVIEWHTPKVLHGGELVATACMTKTTSIWRVGTGEFVHMLAHPTSQLLEMGYVLAPIPRRDLLATVDWGMVVIWNASSGDMCGWGGHLWGSRGEAWENVPRGCRPQLGRNRPHTARI